MYSLIINLLITGSCLAGLFGRHLESLFYKISLNIHYNFTIETIDTAFNVLLKEPAGLGTYIGCLVAVCAIFGWTFYMLFPGDDPDKNETKKEKKKKPETPWEKYLRKKKWRETFDANSKKGNWGREPSRRVESLADKYLKPPRFSR